MTRAFLVEDSDDIPVPDAEERDFSAVDALAPYVGEWSRADRAMNAPDAKMAVGGAA